MDVCGLPKACLIVCNDSSAFQRHHTSVRFAAESPTRFPWAIDTTSRVLGGCIDLLNLPLSGVAAMPAPVDLGANSAVTGFRLDVRAVEFCVFLNFFRFFCVFSSRI